jgi:regulator of sigma E protease
MLVTILVFLLVLSVLVFVHELGHFTVARMHGIKVEEFGFFGFPPRVFGVVWDERAKRRRIIWGHRDEQVAREMTPAESSVAGAVLSESPVAPASFKHTIYSLNWIPFGGFVRIKGEDGQSDPDSFAAKPAWPRIQVLAAGVVMNFLFAWILLSIVLMLGFPQQASDTSDPTVAGQAAEIQIQQVLPGTPAETMGLRMGDVILSVDALEMRTLGQVQTYIQEHKGQEVTFKVDRGGKVLALRGMPRTDYPAREGSLGIVFTSVVTVQYPVGTALVEGAKQTAHLTVAMTEGLGRMLTGGGKLSDVSGPVGIAQYTRQASDLGLAYLLFFAAVLSINLAIINILPFPALDGGRILFVLIETVRGRPVSARVEGWVNQIGFLFLIGLMLLVTAHDIFRALRP